MSKRKKNIRKFFTLWLIFSLQEYHSEMITFYSFTHKRAHENMLFKSALTCLF